MKEKELEEILKDLQWLGKKYHQRWNSGKQGTAPEWWQQHGAGGANAIHEAIINLINKYKHMRFLRKQENAYERYLKFD